MERSKDIFLGAAGVAVVCVGLLLWPLFGHPPYSFFGVLRFSIAAGSIYSACALYTASRKFAPLSFVVLILGGVFAFAKMRRFEWVPFDRAAALAFGLSAVLLLLTSRRLTSGQ